MSERGSLITESISCPICFDKILSALNSSFDFEYVTNLRRGVIAATIKTPVPGGEFIAFLQALGVNYSSCHDVRIAIHSDKGSSAILKLHADGQLTVFHSAKPEQWA